MEQAKRAIAWTLWRSVCCCTLLSLLPPYYVDGIRNIWIKHATSKKNINCYPLTEATLAIPFAVLGSPSGGMAQVSAKCEYSLVTQDFVQKLNDHLAWIDKAKAQELFQDK